MSGQGPSKSSSIRTSFFRWKPFGLKKLMVVKTIEPKSNSQHLPVNPIKITHISESRSSLAAKPLAENKNSKEAFEDKREIELAVDVIRSDVESLYNLPDIKKTKKTGGGGTCTCKCKEVNEIGRKEEKHSPLVDKAIKNTVENGTESTDSGLTSKIPEQYMREDCVDRNSVNQVENKEAVNMVQTEMSMSNVKVDDVKEDGKSSLNVQDQPESSFGDKIPLKSSHERNQDVEKDEKQASESNTTKTDKDSENVKTEPVASGSEPVTTLLEDDYFSQIMWDSNPVDEIDLSFQHGDMKKFFESLKFDDEEACGQNDVMDSLIPKQAISDDYNPSLFPSTQSETSKTAKEDILLASAIQAPVEPSEVHPTPTDSSLNNKVELNNNAVSNEQQLESDKGVSSTDETDSSKQQSSVLRDYQKALYECAKERNTIACLPTGSGKTLIAIKLMNYYRESVSNGKRIFFLANAVPLLKQQAAYISRCTRFRVQMVYGGNKNQWKDWKSTFSFGEVFVIIPTILLALIDHGYISFKEICLIVIDECHHALKANHASLLMQRYKRIMESDTDYELPRVLGLSATIVKKNVKTGCVEEAIKQVEQLLCSKAVTYEDYEKVLLHSSKAEILTHSYERSNDDECTTLCTSLFEKTANAFSMRAAIIGAKLVPPKTEAMMLEMKRMGQERREYLDIVNAIQDIRTVYAGLGIYGAMIAASIKYEYFKGSFVFDFVKPIEKHLFLTSLRRFMFAAYQITHVKTSSGNFVLMASSDKVSKLLTILEKFRENPQDLCGIIFVQRRSEALSLGALIEHLTKHYPAEWGFLRPAVIVGTNASNCENPRYRQTLTKQNEILDAFRCGDINVVIATAILQEGIDVQACSFVVRLDDVATYPSFIQSMGRARKDNAKYHILIPDTSASRHRANISKYKYLYGKINETLQYHLRHIESNLDVPLDPEKEAFVDERKMQMLAKMQFCPGGTNESPAITAHAAVSLVNHYCAIIKRIYQKSTVASSIVVTTPLSYEKRVDQRQGVPDVENDVYQGYVKLPCYSAIKEIVAGPPVVGKENAKRAAFLEVCKSLYKAGALNSHLLPEVNGFVSH